MGPVLDQIFKTGLADGESVPLRSHITVAEGEFLQSIIKEIQPRVCLEVGLAFGISALFIREALDPGCRYIAIDPVQHHDWRGIGLANLHRAGYEVEFYEEASQAALPRLWASGLTMDFAFIDGMHTFDHALVDFFYVDRMLRVGGVLAIDDANWPSLHKLCRFILTNRSYRVSGLYCSTSGLMRRVARQAALSVLTVVPTSIKRHLKPEWQQPDESLGFTYSRLVVLTKQAEDDRRENFHRVF